MGKFEYKGGVDELIKKLDRVTFDQLAPKMLQAAAPIIESSLKGTASAHVRTGSLVGSIKAKKPETDSKGWHVTVRPTGKDGKGVKNMEKAAYLEYGTRKQRATPFMAPGCRACRGACEDAMKQVFEKEMKELKI